MWRAFSAAYVMLAMWDCYLLGARGISPERANILALDILVAVLAYIIHRKDS